MANLKFVSGHGKFQTRGWLSSFMEKGYKKYLPRDHCSGNGRTLMEILA